MSKPTHDRLNAADTTLFDLMEWDNDMRTWERQVVRDARGILRDRMDRVPKEKAAIPDEDDSGQNLNPDESNLTGDAA